MPEYVDDETEDMDEETEDMDEDPEQDQEPNQQPQHPRQPLEVQPDGTWILGRGADRWIPSKNQLGDMRWLVERDLRKELGVPPTWARDEEKIEFHKRQLALLDLAKQPPRCEHVFTDGRCCKAPRVKKGKLCYAHTLMEEKRPLELNLPPLEDANAVMLWLMDVLRGLAEGRISEKTAGIMLYGLQLAMVNARFTTFQDTDHKEMVRKAPKTRAKPQRTRRNSEEEASEDFTAKDAKVAKEDKALPQRTRRNTEEEARADFTAEVAKEEEQREPATGTPRSEHEALPQRTQRSTEGIKIRRIHRILRVSCQRARVGISAEGTQRSQRNRRRKQVRHQESRIGWNPRTRGVSPGLNRLSLYFSGLRQGRGWQVTARYRHHSNRPGKAARARY